MDESRASESNVLLVLMRLDLDDPHPLHAGRASKGHEPRFLDKNKHYQLLMAVLDPKKRATSAPVTGIELTGAKLNNYNRALTDFQRIWKKFYGPDGFITNPTTYNYNEQDNITDLMGRVGASIYALFNDPNNPGRIWLDKLLDSKDRPLQPVTILTNDFGIPWFWLNKSLDEPFLCEVCSLGMLQLSAVGLELYGGNAPHELKCDKYEALLIKGATGLPFLDEELGTIAAQLQDPDKRARRTFKAQRADTRDHIWNLLTSKERQLNRFRLVHFSGHYSGEHLLLGEEELPLDLLRRLLPGSLLVLDGCSSGHELEAWTDMEGLTSTLMNQGALGCLVTALPVKNDPIVSKILWEVFYGNLRRGSITVGQALLKARLALRDHFTAIGSKNPAWAVYQLIGSPAIQLCAEDEESDE